VRGLAEKPVTDDPLAGDQLDTFGIRGGDVRGPSRARPK